MTAFDTNVLVRYLVADDAGQAEAPRMTVELVRVLERAYRFSRDRIATVLDELVATEELVLEAAGDVARAARGYRQGRSDFADLMISAAARRSGTLPLYTFDRRAARLEGAELVGHPGD